MSHGRIPAIPGYRLLTRLGEGGAGVVFLAEARRGPGHLVAIKLLKPGVSVQEKLIRRFVREGRTGKGLDHPNIIRVLACEEWKGTHFIVMEYVEGASLLARAPCANRDSSTLPDGPLWPRVRVSGESLNDNLRALARVAEALEHVHSRGIVHRDVKPGNVLVRGSDGHPFLCDFGLARDLEADTRITSSGAIMGTPNYMSPEQVSGEAEIVGPQSDIWSLGVTAFEIVTGRLPFDGATFEAIRKSILFSEPPRLATLLESPPPGLEDVVFRALEKKPENRYSKAAEMSADLDRIASGDRPSVRHAPIRVRREARRVWIHRAKIGIAVLVVVIAVLALVLHRMGETSRRTKAEGFFAQGLDAAEKHDLSMAEESIARGIELSPSDPVGYLHLAAARFLFEQRAAALQSLARARELGFSTEPTRLRTSFDWFALGLFLESERRWTEAANAYERSVELDPERYQAHFQLYGVTAILGDHERAHAALERFRNSRRRVDPRHDLVEALFLELTGEDSASLSILERLADTWPEDRQRENRLARHLGRLLVRADRLEEGEAMLRRAVEDSADDGPSLANLAVAMVKKGRFSDGREFAERAIKVDPSLSNAWETLAFAYCSEGRHDDALRRIESDEAFARSAAAKRIAKGVTISAVESAFAAFRQHHRAGEHLDCVESLESLLSFDPDHFPALSYLGSEKWNQGEFAEARARYRKARDVFARLPDGSRKDLQTVLVGIFGCSAELGDEATAEEALLSIDIDSMTGAGTQLNFVRALFSCPLERLQDKPLARELKARWKLCEVYADDRETAEELRRMDD